ncbi:protein neuralized [Nephila pilipes]|uniref:Protein neuralized n=1 Tax=Nephila pilipes TaxID=299642 RepID=A0A8X6U726_NEPPI|nr:protein neuralized [Nephila pilipes]
MKFHGVHGCNVLIDEGGCRASRTSSFCDGITFSSKPLAINSRISLHLGANEDWTGALRIGVTTNDPAAFANKKLPRYVCPDLTSKPGFWARPLPEIWAKHGNRLTFYVNCKGQLHLFVNNDHKGAVLTGLPLKEQLWILLDLYGISVSAKFVSNSGSAPSEVIARGPEAVEAYQHALTHGSTPYYHTRLALVGPPDGKKTLLKKLLVKPCESFEPEQDGIDTICVCQTSENSNGQPWILVKAKNKLPTEDGNNNEQQEIIEENSEKTDDESPLVISPDEEYFKAIAINIVKEMILQRRKSKEKEDRKKTPGVKSTFRLQSSLSKIGTSRGLLKLEDGVKENTVSNENEELPDDLPRRVVELVETMLKESECKQIWEKKESEKQTSDNAVLTFNIWNYSGHAKYLFLHQLFLSPQTIYLFVFDLTQNLDSPVQNAEDYGLEFTPSCEFSSLSLLHLWLEMIYVSLAHPKEEQKNQEQDNMIPDLICTLFPPVLIVGIQEDSTTFDAAVEHQFNKIKESIQDKIYYHLVHPTFYYVGNPETTAVDSMIVELRGKIQELALQLPHFGTELPLKWMLFEQAVDRLIEREVYFADINKLAEVARLENIESDEEFYSMVHFYHHQGKIWHLGSEQFMGTDDINGIVILKPQWFINYAYQLLNPDAYLSLKGDSTEISSNTDVIISKNFENIWPNTFHHTNILLDILNCLDVVCEIPEELTEVEEEPDLSKYLIPWLMEPKIENNSNFEGLILVLDFSGLLPVGFFTRFIVRLFRWSARHDWKGNTNLFSRRDEVPVDYNHSIRLQKIHGHRVQVAIIQRNYLDAEEGIKFSFPSPHICSKVRHLLERETENLRDIWYKRMSYSVNIPCPCSKPCKLHEVKQCTDHQCMHLLPLNECLTKKIVECDYRLVKTDFIQKYFFSTSIEGDPIKYSHSIRLSMDGTSTPIGGNYFWNDADFSQEEPPWISVVGKMLIRANTGQDWIALAKRLGYNEREIRRFAEETIPPVAVLNNWIDSNGRTRYCIDLLITCLEQMSRQDVADYIFAELGPELPSPPVFISYQWESQETVLHLRRRIELAGFPCWMDVGNLQGGEALYGKIYEGINKAKVVLCCLTPRYVLSPLCTREMSLADVLRKPIVPIILEPMPWPPPGALALILSSLVYIDLCGIGGHGGNGKQSDWESRFSNIVERLSHFISPSFLSPHITNPSSERHASSSPPVIIRNPEDFLETLGQSDNQDLMENDVRLPDDTPSETASVPDPSPVVWENPRRNRVVRCSVCTIL